MSCYRDSQCGQGYRCDNDNQCKPINLPVPWDWIGVLGGIIFVTLGMIALISTQFKKSLPLAVRVGIILISFGAVAGLTFFVYKEKFKPVLDYASPIGCSIPSYVSDGQCKTCSGIATFDVTKGTCELPTVSCPSSSNSNQTCIPPQVCVNTKDGNVCCDPSATGGNQTICCGKGQEWKSDPNNPAGQCAGCPSGQVMCGGQCRSSGCVCVNGECCDVANNKYQCSDADGNPVCCDEPCCGNGKCCSSVDANTTCVNGVCQQKCPSDCLSPSSCPVGQKCFRTVDELGNVNCGCVPNAGCMTEGASYEPSNDLTCYRGGEDDITVTTAGVNASWCRDDSDQGPWWRKVSWKFKGDTCNNPAVCQYYAEHTCGLSNATWDEATKTCSAIQDCSSTSAAKCGFKSGILPKCTGQSSTIGKTGCDNGAICGAGEICSNNMCCSGNTSPCGSNPCCPQGYCKNGFCTNNWTFKQLYKAVKGGTINTSFFGFICPDYHDGGSGPIYLLTYPVDGYNRSDKLDVYIAPNVADGLEPLANPIDDIIFYKYNFKTCGWTGATWFIETCDTGRYELICRSGPGSKCLAYNAQKDDFRIHDCDKCSKCDSNSYVFNIQNIVESSGIQHNKINFIPGGGGCGDGNNYLQVKSNGQFSHTGSANDKGTNWFPILLSITTDNTMCFHGGQ